MNILLTGATGFLGYRTLEKLVELPYINHIIATGRNLPPYRQIKKEKNTLHYFLLYKRKLKRDIQTL